MDFSPANRLLQLPTGIFADLAERKRAAMSRGLNVIDLSVGSPDLPPPPQVRAALTEAIADTSQYGYAVIGSQAFSDAAARFYHARYGVQVDPTSEVLQVMGSQEGLAHLAMALLNEGDTVLIPDPGYPIYEASVRIAGATPVSMPLRDGNGFLPRLDGIPQEIATKARMMILNHPGNPVPSLATRAFFEEVVAFARKFDILVVHDFAYSELLFDGHRPLSFLSVDGAKDVGIEFNSLSKTFNMAGARIGYVLGNASAISALALLKSHIDYGVFLPIQHAATVALNTAAGYGSRVGTDEETTVDPLVSQAAIYQRRRDALVAGLAKHGWQVTPPPATMFIWAKLPDASAKSESAAEEPWTSRRFALALIEEAGVAVTPGDAFGQEGEGYVRIALVHSEGLLSEAAERIGRFLNQHGLGGQRGTS